MAYATHTHASTLSLAARLTEIREHASDAYKSWRVYRNTVNELSDLTDRDLADLGIHRSEINGIAMDAAYGQPR